MKNQASFQSLLRKKQMQNAYTGTRNQNLTSMTQLRGNNTGIENGRISPLNANNRDLHQMNRTNTSMIGTSKLVADVNSMHKINMQ